MKRLLLLSLFAVLAGCQRPNMVLPTMFEAGEVAPLADTPVEQQSDEHTLFYATDRQFKADKNSTGSYNHRRGDQLSLGQLTIGLGPQGAWQAFDAATKALPGGKRPTPKLTTIKRLGIMRWGSDDPYPEASDRNNELVFIKQLNTALNQSDGKAINIYIHGFQNSFEESAKTASEMSLYSGGIGPYILYSWTSLNSIFDYSHDRDSVNYTVGYIRRLIQMLNDEIDEGRLAAKQINLIAHSTGAEVAGTVLRELGLISSNDTPEQRQAKWRIGSVLLIAPDISADVACERIFKEDLQGIYKEFVVYISKRDKALKYVNSVLYGTPRLGSIRENELTNADRDLLSRRPDIALINIDSQSNGDPYGHSHHRFSGATLSDVLLCLRSDLPPSERGLVRKDGAAIWQFADDYRQRVTEAAIKVYGKADTQ